MPTLLDELIVKIGLDGSGFQTQVASTQSALTKVGATARGEAKSLEEYLKKTQEETGFRIKQVEAVGRQASKQFTSMKNNVLGLLGALAGAYGLESFFKSIVTGDASLGNFAKTLGVSTDKLATWIEMGKRTGASADAVKQAFVAINQIQQDILLHGTSSATPTLNAMGLSPMDDMGRPKEIITFLKEIGEWAKSHPPEQLRAVFGAIGLPPEMIPLLNKGKEGLNKLEEEMRALGVATAKSAEEDQNLLNRFSDIEQAIRDVGRALLHDMMPYLEEATKATKAWILANKDWIEQDIKKYAIEFGAALKEIPEHFKDWKSTMQTLWVAAGPFFIAMIAGFNPIVAAVLALTAALVLLKKEISPSEWAPDSPFWRGMSREEQLKYPDSPASIEQNGRPGGGSGSWIWDQIKGVFVRGGGAGGANDARLASVRDKFANDPRLGISREAASGLASNLNAESGIRGINEANNGPGFGWAQWTNTQGSPRRTNFETFARSKGLDPSSDEANYEFLVDELRTKYPQVLAQLRRGDITALQAATEVARNYIVPPATQIPGHVADAERVAKLPVPPIPPAAAPKLAPVSAIDPGYSLALRGQSAAGADYSRTSSVETHINGPIQVQTSATDADGIARGIGEALRKYAYVPQVNTGLA